MVRPRIWLVAGLGEEKPPPEKGVSVSDDQGRTWIRGRDGTFHTPDNRHHQSWSELHRRTDLTEVTR